MGQFVFECQEIAENNYNDTKEKVISEVKQTFEVWQQPYAIDVAVSCWEEIQSDMQNYF